MKTGTLLPSPSMLALKTISCACSLNPDHTSGAWNSGVTIAVRLTYGISQKALMSESLPVRFTKAW